jgi:Helicase HerA, central domain
MTSVLGKDGDGKSITIDKAERREGLYIIGSSGTGKSTLLTSLIQQDIQDNIGVCVADPHGDLIQRTIELMPPEKYKDVILLDIANPLYVFGLNIFHCENPQDLFAVENVISGVMHILDKVYNISNLTPQMNQYFLNITQTLLYNAPLSILDVPRLFSNKKFRLKLASNVPNTQVRWLWTEFFENRAKFRRDDEMSAVSNKLDDFFRPALKTIFGQEITTINMREIMDDPAGKILLVKMNARWESITKILGSVIVSQILDAAYSRSDIPIKKRRQFHLYADEFQWFASQDFSTLFSEARKYGIGLTIAHQTLEQVDPHIIATCKQAKTIITFRVSGENAESLSTQFDSTPPEPEMEESGRRKKQTPVKDVVGHLLRQGSHDNPIINRFATGTLQKLETTAKESERQGYSSRFHIDNMNRFLYEAMTMETPSPETVFPNCMSSLQPPLFMHDFHAWWHNEIAWSDTFLPAWSPRLYESVK